MPEAAVPTVREATDTAVPGAVPRAVLVRSGAELVELGERFYRGVFIGILVFGGTAALAALVFLPLRQPAGVGPPLSGLIGAGLLVLGAPAAVRYSASLYCALRRHVGLELGLVAYAAALVSVVHPLHSQLWWPSCGLLMLVAVVAPLRRAIVYCLAVLATNLVAHILAGDIGTTPPVTIIGLWVGFIFWTSTVGACSDQFAAHLLRLNIPQRPGAPARQAFPTGQHNSGAEVTQVPDPRRPADSLSPLKALPPARSSEDPADQPRRSAAGTADGGTRGIVRLTARQLQVVALLADGLSYCDAAACLSIAPGQVQRHVARAVARLGLHNANELVAHAVAEGLVPPIDLAGPRPGSNPSARAPESELRSALI